MIEVPWIRAEAAGTDVVDEDGAGLRPVAPPQLAPVDTLKGGKEQGAVGQAIPAISRPRAAGRHGPSQFQRYTSAVFPALRQKPQKYFTCCHCHPHFLSPFCHYRSLRLSVRIVRRHEPLHHRKVLTKL